MSVVDCCLATSALVGIVIVGRLGLDELLLFVGTFSSDAFRDESPVDGRVSVTATVTGSDGFTISNSGSPLGGLVEYFVLSLRAGECFFSDGIVRSCEISCAPILDEDDVILESVSDRQSTPFIT